MRQGKGSFVDAHTVAVEGEGGTKTYTAKIILIAVGGYLPPNMLDSSACVPPSQHAPLLTRATVATEARQRSTRVHASRAKAVWWPSICKRRGCGWSIERRGWSIAILPQLSWRTLREAQP